MPKKFTWPALRKGCRDYPDQACNDSMRRCIKCTSARHYNAGLKACKIAYAKGQKV